MIRAAGEGFVITDTAGKVLYLNTAFARISGYTAKDILGKNLKMLRSGKHSEGFYTQMLTTIRQGRPFTTEIINKHKSGRFYSVNLTITPMLDSSSLVEGFVAIFSDLTEHKRAEEALLAKAVAEKANQAKSDFLNTMSHELRSPLTSIIGFSVLVLKLVSKDKITKESYLNIKEYMLTLDRAAQHLLELINDVLDYAKMGSSNMDLRYDTFGIQEVLDQIKLQFDNALNDKSLKLQIMLSPELPKIKADRTRLMQILVNLISNAIKFTNQGLIKIIAEIEQGNFVLKVIDSGVGIRAEDIPTIFDKFKQVGRNKSEQQGTGLGLAITKRLVELHSGEIKVISEVGVGTTFIISLPIKGEKGWNYDTESRV